MAAPERDQRYLADSAEAPRSARTKFGPSLPYPTHALLKVVSITVRSPNPHWVLGEHHIQGLHRI